MIKRKIGGAKISRREPQITRKSSIDVTAIGAALAEFIEKELGDLLRLVKVDVPNGIVDMCLPIFSYVLRETVRAYTGLGAATLTLERSGAKELSFILELCEIPNPESFAPALALEGQSGLKLEFIENRIIMKTTFFPKTKLTIRSRDKKLLESELMIMFFGF